MGVIIVKYLKKLKYHKIAEICFWLLFVVVSYHLWTFKEFDKTAAYYDTNSVIEVLDDPTYHKILYALNDEDATQLNDYKLTLINNTYREEKYNVYLAISKNIADNHLKIRNDNLRYIKDLYAYEDDDYRYYLLDTNTLTGSEKKYNFSLYNDIDGENFIPYDLKIELEKI